MSARWHGMDPRLLLFVVYHLPVVYLCFLFIVCFPYALYYCMFKFQLEETEMERYSVSSYSKSHDLFLDLAFNTE